MNSLTLFMAGVALAFGVLAHVIIEHESDTVKTIFLIALLLMCAAAIWNGMK